MIHKARYSIPGSFVAETETRVLEYRSAQEALEAAPPNAYCFTLYDLADSPPDLGPEYKVVPTIQNESATYYIGGTVYTYEQLEHRAAATGEDFKILLSNMRGNGWDRIIECRTGNWQTLGPDDVVLPVP